MQDLEAGINYEFALKWMLKYLFALELPLKCDRNGETINCIDYKCATAEDSPLS